MQSRRDQLQAYRFMVRRAVGAVVTGDPDIQESPMRRLTITTLSGVMIAVLVAAGFGLFGLLRPGPSDKWKSEGAIVVDPNGSRYVYLSGTLYPTTNYVSAVLYAYPNASKVTQVSAASLAHVRRGQALGVAGLPDSLPSDSDGLTTNPWAVCSTQSSATQGSTLSTSLIAGRSAGVKTLAADRALYVRNKGGDRFLLMGGKAFAIDSDADPALQLASSPVFVSDAFLRGIQQGATFTALRLPHFGDASTVTVNGSATKVGDLVTVGGGRHFVITDSGYTAVSDFQYALLALVPGHGSLTSAGSPVGNQTSRLDTDIPSDRPQVADDGGQAYRVCDTYTAKNTTSGTWSLGYATTSTAFDQAGQADDDPQQAGSVQLKGDDGAALVSYVGSSSGESGDKSQPVEYLLAQTGELYQVPQAHKDVLKGLHFDGAAVTSLPLSIIRILPKGADLNPCALPGRQSC